MFDTSTGECFKYILFQSVPLQQSRIAPCYAESTDAILHEPMYISINSIVFVRIDIHFQWTEKSPTSDETKQILINLVGNYVIMTSSFHEKLYNQAR